LAFKPEYGQNVKYPADVIQDPWIYTQF